MTQTGQVTVGDSSKSAAHLTVNAGATWGIAADVGIGIGTAKTSGLTIAGTLIKTAGVGKSVVALKTADTGVIEVASGTLDFTQALSGKGGVMKIDAGATLELDNSAAKTLGVQFNGAGSTLALKKPTKMAATISGFTAGETIDLLKIAATGATLNGSDQLTIVNGSNTVATLQLSGNYAGQTFSAVSDGHGGTAITVSGGGAFAPSFAAAMAGLGGGAEAPASSSAAIHRPPPGLFLPAH